jgi:hypothetical protein
MGWSKAEFTQGHRLLVSEERRVPTLASRPATSQRRFSDEFIKSATVGRCKAPCRRRIWQKA